MFNDEKELDEKYIHFLNIYLFDEHKPPPHKKENKQKTSQQNC